MEIAFRVERQVLGVVEGCLVGRPSIPVITHQAEPRAEKGPAAAPLGGVVARAAARPDPDGSALEDRRGGSCRTIRRKCRSGPARRPPGRRDSRTPPPAPARRHRPGHAGRNRRPG